MSSFKDQMAEYQQILKKKAVYQLMLDHLLCYIDTDVKKANDRIQFKHDDITITVDQTTLEEAKGDMTLIIDSLADDLGRLEKQ